MNLYHLRYFSTLAHIEHYTKAADILAITQPSLSYAISTLEEELGVKLFEKNGRNVTLTKYGKVFLNDVEEVLNRLDSSVNSLKLAGKVNFNYVNPVGLKDETLSRITQKNFRVLVHRTDCLIH